MTTAIITGHGGFIGSHFTQALLNDPAYDDVIGVDTKSPVAPKDARDLFKVQLDKPADLVVHCAANVGGRARIDGDPLAIAENLAIDSDFWRWVRRGNARRVVYFSSSAAYPVRLQERGRVWDLRESDIYLDDADEPDQTYGWGKLTGERLARLVASETDVAVHVFRPFSGYGTDQALDYPFPSFMARGAKRPKLFQVWGDGRAVRDFVHVDDIVQLVMTAVHEDIRGTYNLATGRGVTFNDLAGMVATTFGFELRLDHLLDKPVGVHRRVGDTAKLISELGEPKISLEEGIYRAAREGYWT